MINKPISRHQPTFQGYFAAPLKNIHIQGFNPPFVSLSVAKKLEEQTRHQDFDILIHTGSGVKSLRQSPNTQTIHPISGVKKWLQDTITFLEGHTILLPASMTNNKALSKIIKDMGATEKASKSNLQGGDFFIGKNKKGEKFIIVGEEEFKGGKGHLYDTKEEAIKLIANDFNISEENVFFIKNMDYHLDVDIRPLNYPYVLVQDDQLMEKTLEENGLGEISRRMKAYRQKENYSNQSETIASLKQEGLELEIIPVPGRVIYFQGEDDPQPLNFMNSIVHQKEDGKLIYITQKSTLSETTGIDFEEIFETHLKKACPQIEEVVFIEAKDAGGNNLLMHYLEKQGGGLHCLTLEEPDFERWKS